LAHGHNRPARPEREGRKTAQQGVNPRPGSAWPAEAGCLAGVRAGATARLGQRPAAISGHGSASKRAQELCEAMAKASRQPSTAEKGRKRTLHGGRARRRHGRRWRGAGKLTQGSEGGASASVSRRKARRSCGCEELENGTVVWEINVGGATGAARAELELSALEGRRGNAGGSERARGHQQVKAGAWARCQAAAAARRVTPACGRHAAEVFCRGRGVARRPAGERRGAREKGQRAELGWAEARWAGAGDARGVRLAGTRPGRLRQVGQKRGAMPTKEEKFFSK